MTLGFRSLLAVSPAHPASLPVRVPTVAPSTPGPFAPDPRGSNLAYGYGWRHLPRRAPFSPVDTAPARHTSSTFTRFDRTQRAITHLSLTAPKGPTSTALGGRRQEQVAS